MSWIKDFTKKIIGTNKITFDNNSVSYSEEEEYIEVNPTKEDNKNKINIKYYNIDDYADIKLILNKIRENNIIILLNIKKLKAKDMSELKRAISKIKRTCEAVGGDISGIDENLVLIYPNFVSISKEDLK